MNELIRFITIIAYVSFWLITAGIVAMAITNRVFRKYRFKVAKQEQQEHIYDQYA